MANNEMMAEFLARSGKKDSPPKASGKSRTDIVLFKVDSAAKLLAEAKTAEETINIIDVAAATEIYLKRKKASEEAIQSARQLKLSAMRKLGQMLKTTKLSKGKILRGTKLEPRENYGRDDPPPTLAEMGIDKKLSA